MANLIQIKRSLGTGAADQPGSLQPGELAFTSNGGVLFIGNTSAVVPIAGVRNPGTLTANQALVANSTSGIDKIIVANAAISQLNANGSTGTAGQILKSGGPGSNSYWSDTSASVAGSNTQVQFNDGGSLAGDSGLTFNKTSDTLSTNSVSANTISLAGNVSSSNLTSGTLTVTGGVGVTGRINTGDLAAGNDSVYSSLTGTSLTTSNVFASQTVNALVLSVGGWVVANQSGVFTSGVVNGDIISVGTSFKANTTRVVIGSGVGLQANGGIGSAGQALFSNGTSVYWDTVSGDITEVTAGDGLTGGGTSGSVTLDVGAGNGIAVNSSAVAVKANTGLVANSDGLFVNSSYIATIDANNSSYLNGKTESNLNVNSALTANLATYVAANDGIVSNSSGVFVKAGTGVVVNATGVHVNSSYIGTLAANSATYLNGKTESNLNVNNALTANLSSYVTANDGIVSNSSGVFVKAGTGVTVNATGVHIGQAVSTTSNVTFANVVTTGFTSQDVIVNGNTKLGDSSSDVVTFTARVNTAIVPSSNVTYDIGTSGLRWANGYFTNLHGDYITIAGNAAIGGDLVITGNLVTQNVSSLNVVDPLIYLAGNNYSSDLVDIGFAGNYNNGSANVHTGLARHAADDQYYLFKGLTQELSATNVINIADPSFTLADLNAYLKSGALVSNSSYVKITANSTVAVQFVANTLSLTTALPATSGGTGQSSYTAGDLLTAANGTHLSKLALGTNGYVLQSNGSAVVYATLDGGTF